MSAERYLSYFAQDDPLAPEELSAILTRRAAALAAPPPDEAKEEALTLFTFSLDANDQRYGIQAANVVSILPLTTIAPVPRTPDFVLGVIGARGRLLSAVDLRRFFGQPAANLHPDGKIIIVSDVDSGIEAGIFVQSVGDLLTVFKSDIHQTLTTENGRQAKFIQGIAPGMLTILNIKALLNDSQFIVHEQLN